MPAWRGMRERQAEFAAAIQDEGLSISQAAERFGISRRAVTYWLRKLGLRSRHQRTQPILADAGRGPEPLYAIARREGLHYLTLYYRWLRGERGAELIRAPRPAPKPQTYELGISVAQWREYAQLADEIGLEPARRKLGVPRGALAAAIAEQWHRLG